MESRQKRGEARQDSQSEPTGAGWYVIVQGREQRVERHDSVPNTKHEPGEKMIRVSGPYPDQETARKVVDRLNGKFEPRPVRRKER